jgi:hypothetical protein
LLIRIFFGEQWLDLKYVFMILSLALVFRIDIRLTDCYLRSLALTKSQFGFRIVEFTLKTICLVVGSFWGLMGFALGGIIAVFITTLIKLLYINRKIGFSFVETMLTIMSSWRAGLLFIPVFVLCFIFLPSNLVGNVANCLIMVVLFSSVFLFFPRLVGKAYQENVYPKIMSKLKRNRNGE